MKVNLKYISICIQIILMNFGINTDPAIPTGKDHITSENLRIKRQAGYVYDKPTVSFDLPTATSIATTQATNVDRIQMQMYYAYPVPSGGSGDANVGLQNTGSTAESTAAVSGTGAGGYNYQVQNTQVSGSQGTTLTETQNTVATGYQYNAGTGAQVITSTGSTGYSSGGPAAGSNTGTITGSVSTSAPRYLPPKSAGENTVSVSVTTSNQAETGSRAVQPSDSYIPPSNQVSSSGNAQTVTTQTGANILSSANVNPSTSYLLPNPGPQQTAIVSTNSVTAQSSVQSKPSPVQSAPAQQYLPPINTSTGVKTELPISAPASTYLPPVF